MQYQNIEQLIEQTPLTHAWDNFSLNKYILQTQTILNNHNKNKGTHQLNTQLKHLFKKWDLTEKNTKRRQVGLLPIAGNKPTNGQNSFSVANQTSKSNPKIQTKILTNQTKDDQSSNRQQTEPNRQKHQILYVPAGPQTKYLKTSSTKASIQQTQNTLSHINQSSANYKSFNDCDEIKKNQSLSNFNDPINQFKATSPQIKAQKNKRIRVYIQQMTPLQLNSNQDSIQPIVQKNFRLFINNKKQQTDIIISTHQTSEINQEASSNDFQSLKSLDKYMQEDKEYNQKQYENKESLSICSELVISTENEISQGFQNQQKNKEGQDKLIGIEETEDNEENEENEQNEEEQQDYQDQQNQQNSQTYQGQQDLQNQQDQQDSQNQQDQQGQQDQENQQDQQDQQDQQKQQNLQKQKDKQEQIHYKDQQIEVLSSQHEYFSMEVKQILQISPNQQREYKIPQEILFRKMNKSSEFQVNQSFEWQKQCKGEKKNEKPLSMQQVQDRNPKNQENQVCQIQKIPSASENMVLGKFVEMKLKYKHRKLFNHRIIKSYKIIDNSQEQKQNQIEFTENSEKQLHQIQQKLKFSKVDLYIISKQKSQIFEEQQSIQTLEQLCIKIYNQQIIQEMHFFTLTENKVFLEYEQFDDEIIFNYDQFKEDHKRCMILLFDIIMKSDEHLSMTLSRFQDRKLLKIKPHFEKILITHIFFDITNFLLLDKSYKGKNLVKDHEQFKVIIKFIQPSFQKFLVLNILPCISQIEDSVHHKLLQHSFIIDPKFQIFQGKQFDQQNVINKRMKIVQNTFYQNVRAINSFYFQILNGHYEDEVQFFVNKEIRILIQDCYLVEELTTSQYEPLSSPTKLKKDKKITLIEQSQYFTKNKTEQYEIQDIVEEVNLSSQYIYKQNNSFQMQDDLKESILIDSPSNSPFHAFMNKIQLFETIKQKSISPLRMRKKSQVISPNKSSLKSSIKKQGDPSLHQLSNQEKKTPMMNSQNNLAMDCYSVQFRSMMISNEMRRPHDINELIMYLVQVNSFHEVKQVFNNKLAELVTQDKNQKINLNHQDSQGNTSLIVSAQLGNTEIITFLLNNGADPNIMNNDGDTALQKALEFYEFEAADLLFDKQINKKNYQKPV